MVVLNTVLSTAALARDKYDALIPTDAARLVLDVFDNNVVMS